MQGLFLMAMAAGFHLHSDGYGPVRVGMTVPAAEKALGVGLRADDGEAECLHVEPVSGHAGVSFMVQDGKITRASLYPGKTDISTPRGVTLGDAEAKVRRLYGARLKVERHAYGDENSRYLTYWVGANRGVRFEIDGGKVTAIHGGDRTIRLVEGCS
jgi:hypothetical protein